MWSRPLPSQDVLKSAFIYDEQTGFLFGGFGYSGHRIIWKLIHGVDPDTIDHINGCRHDNRLCNLRNVSRDVNRLNRLPTKDRILPKGVCLRPESGRFRARVRRDNKLHILGTFDTVGEASEAVSQFCGAV